MFQLIQAENELTQKLKNAKVTENLEEIIKNLTEQFEQQGSLKKIESLWIKSTEGLEQIKNKLLDFDKKITKKSSLIEKSITQFNKFFSKISNNLYEEEYILSSNKGVRGYDLEITNMEGNPGLGMKKGQIAAFDLAYIKFADALKMRCLHFILHDQLEVMDNNSLKTLIEVASNINGQYIVPILRDKIPSNIDVNQFEVLSLSQEEKLFKLP